jgi:A/G-specific adenine glycosylase
LFDSEEALRSALSAAQQKQLHFEPAFVHVLTHKDLHLHVAQLALPAASVRVGMARWVHASDWPALGLPAPIRKLLTRGV